MATHTAGEFKIAWRFWSAQFPQFFVAQVPGEDGVDWGYVTRAEDAKPLNAYWCKRFAADCRRVGVTAQFRAAVKEGAAS